MPIEFGAAAYRFGHSMVRPSYRANFTSGTGDSTSPTADPFFALVFDPNEPDFSGPVTYDRDDLLGGYPGRRAATSAGRRSSTSATARSRTTRRSTPRSPACCSRCRCRRSRRTPRPRPTVLPQRNLLRQLTWGLPSGQAVARAMGVAALSPADLADIAGVYAPFATSTPLWYYILAEAKAIADGLHLGPGRRPDRHRDADRAAARRPHQLPQRLPRASSRSSAPTSRSGPTPTRTSPATAPTPARTSSTTPASSTPGTYR